MSGKQSTFVGSERQVRGRIVDALRQGPILVSELSRLGRETDTDADVQRIAMTLVADGLAEQRDEFLTLPL